jgi:geranylgeranyl diphosphate synthase, type II
VRAVQPMQAPDALREVVDGYLSDLELPSELGDQRVSVRYALAGGKRVRAQICLATAEASGGEIETALPAAAALELVHAFSLVHDDLPALDNDAERRGQASVWVQFGEHVAILAGDALLAEAFRQASSYPSSAIARELAEATLGMIGGQYLDVTGSDGDLAELHRLKTGRLFAASVGLGLWAADVPVIAQAPWRAFGEELGALFQIVDDLLDGDGYAARHGAGAARTLADEAADRASTRLAAIDADTTVLHSLVDELAVRTA